MHAYHLQCDSASEMQTLTLTTFPVKWFVRRLNFLGSRGRMFLFKNIERNKLLFKIRNVTNQAKNDKAPACAEERIFKFFTLKSVS